MSADFDPYREWLGIEPKDQPPTYYRLFGLSPFESDAGLITKQTSRAIGQLWKHQSGPHREECRHILTELAAARACLRDPIRKAEYDARLRSISMNGDGKATPTEVADESQPASDSQPAEVADSEAQEAQGKSVALVSMVGVGGLVAASALYLVLGIIFPAVDFMGVLRGSEPATNSNALAKADGEPSVAQTVDADDTDDHADLTSSSEAVSTEPEDVSEAGDDDGGQETEAITASDGPSPDVVGMEADEQLKHAEAERIEAVSAGDATGALAMAVQIDGRSNSGVQCQLKTLDELRAYARTSADFGMIVPYAVEVGTKPQANPTEAAKSLDLGLWCARKAGDPEAVREVTLKILEVRK